MSRSNLTIVNFVGVVQVLMQVKSRTDGAVYADVDETDGTTCVKTCTRDGRTIDYHGCYSLLTYGKLMSIVSTDTGVDWHDLTLAYVY